MVEKMSSYIVDNMLYKGEKIDGEKREIMMFGITRILEDVPKYVLIFLIALFLNILKEVAIVLLITFIYKTFIGGAHANSNISCFIFSLIFFITPGIISKFINISDIYFLILLTLVNVFSIYVIKKYAPADTEEVPVLNKKKRKIMQIAAVISQILIDISLFFIIKDNNIKEIILITIVYSNFMTTNFAYKFLKCTRSKDSEEFKQYFN